MRLRRSSFAIQAMLFMLTCMGLPLALWAYANSSSDADTLPIGYIAQLEVSSYDLSQAGSTSPDPITGLPSTAPGLETLYRPQYNRRDWSGDLLAYPLNAFGDIYPRARWSAAAALANQHWDSQRRIATLGSSGTVAGIAFRGALLAGTTVNGVTYSPTQTLNYLRGDSSNDTAHAGSLRARSTPLGDIVHSRPYYVTDASNPTVFVGANDGMLHAFDANNGAERWAYVPSMLLDRLPDLVKRHGYFVDGQINVGTIQGHGNQPIRALFGGLGGGGKGLYALDISSLATPASEAALAAKAMWEIAADATGSSSTLKTAGQAVSTNTDYAHLGNTHGTPLLVKIKTSQDATPSYVDALIVGNGHDDHAAGMAHLYVIQAATGALMKDFTVASHAGLGGANGIFSPAAIDSNQDGFADTVYGADLNGSLWKFDLSAPWTSSTSWTAPIAPLFSNRNANTGVAQPVTASLGVAAHPRGGYMVTFGTGSTLQASRNLDIHYIYGIWDGAPNAGTITPTDLLTQTLTEEQSNGSRIRHASNNTPNWSKGGHKGWKLALPAGERVVGEGSFIENSRFCFNSYNPTTASSTDPVSGATVMGENWLMQLDYLSGGSRNAVAGQWIAGGVQSQPILLQLDHGSTTLFNQNLDIASSQTGTRLDTAGTMLATSATTTQARQTTPQGTTLTTTTGMSKTATPSSDVHGGQLRTGRMAWRELLRIN